MLWFNFILGSDFIFLCFKLILIHYHVHKRRKIKLVIFDNHFPLTLRARTVQGELVSKFCHIKPARRVNKLHKPGITEFDFLPRTNIDIINALFLLIQT